MRVINHNWSAMKQRLHLQSVAEISRHSVLSGDRIRQCETSSGSRHKDTDQCLQVAISFLYMVYGLSDSTIPQLPEIWSVRCHLVEVTYDLDQVLKNYGKPLKS